MKAAKPFTCRGVRSKPWSIAVVCAMILSTISTVFVPTVKAQTAPIGQGFSLDADDLRFIYHAIQVAQDHSSPVTTACPGCGTLLGPGPNQVNLFGTPNPQLPLGLRTTDGSFNNLVQIPDQHNFGRADLIFPRLTVPNFRSAEPLPFDPDGPGGQAAGDPTSYAQKSGFVSDSQPRIISNLIVDQTANNPAAFAAAANPCGSGGFVCQGSTTPDPVTGALFIPNITPDFGLSAPFNLMFTFFGQFFDHGLDLVNKGGSGTVIMPLQPDDPLFVAGAQTNFMVLTRATNQPGPDGILGTADDIQEGINQTTPWVDQNQTYTSHPAHQVYLRQYQMVAGRPVQDGKMLDGGFCAPRGTGIPGDQICNIGDWAEVKAQTATKLGIRLADQDVFDAPLLLTDPYGHFKPGPNGFPQLILPGNALLEGDPTANGGTGVAVPANAFRTGHAFLNDIAHNAAPSPGLVADADTTICDFRTVPSCQAPGTFDNELLDRHFVTGDGRGNENIALTTMHTLFHAEHNRLVADIDRLINTPGFLTAAEAAAWHSVHAGSGWTYGERLFQAARFCTEMEYQHIVFEEFARKVQPLVNAFLGGITSINPAIKAEFAHTVYRLGHSMLPEIVSRINVDAAGVETQNDIRLFNAFLNPVSFNDGGPAGTLTAPQAAGSIVRGLSRTVGNELDEFVTDSVRNTLVGLPLDLPAINMARGRSEGIPSLNSARRQFFAATRNSAVTPYTNWFEFGLNLRHRESLVNFVAAYGTDPTITSVSTIADKRAAAATLVAANGPFMFAPAATSGLDNVDFWVGGLAERQAAFGGLLGSTFNFVFEQQLEDLQNGDRFYYLQRLDGLGLRFQLEGNSLAELARRNTNVGDTMAAVFETADFNFNLANFTGTAPVDLGDGAQLLTLLDGTKLFFDPLHKGKNVMFNGTPGDDRMSGDIGDDTFYGNAGNDRIEGNDGNDRIFGGEGNDILFGGNGDDIIEGGPGHDALSSGPGFGGDIMLGGDGNDFLLGGDDGVEHFGGPGNDIMVDGAMRAEGIFGGPGDDWLDAGDGHDGGMFGDNGNVFDLLAGLSAIGGDDVLDGGPGQDNHFGEGGDDIMIMNEGSNKFFGDFGFDWFTMRGWPAPADEDLDLLALPNTPINFNDLRNKYRLVDGISGWDFNDILRGDSRSNDPTLPLELQNLPGMELTAAGAAKITGLTQLMSDFGATLPFSAGDIMLGGRGSDLIEGKGGNDLIDGDLWLNVQLRAVLNDGTVKLVNTPRDLSADIFSDPQRLNPGNITIVRTIVTPVVPAGDCGAAVPLNCDTAMWRGNRADYTITNRTINGTNVVTVVANVKVAGIVGVTEGTDTLRHIEQLQFADVTIPAPGGGGAGVTTVAVPNVVGLTQAAAVASLTGAQFVTTATNGNSTTAAVGSVISQSPAAGTLSPFGSTVGIVITVGTIVPNVVTPAQSLATATAAITAAGLTVGTVTVANSATVAAGNIISQSPPSGTTAAPGTAVALVRSLGPALVAVPNVVGQLQAAAVAAIGAASLTAGPITTLSSLTVAVGRVISSTPVAGTLVSPGSSVALVISTGPPVGLVAAFGFDEASGFTAINSVNASFNGTIREALRAPGKIGRALHFDGFNDWVTVRDTTASPLDLTTGMTLEAWVNPEVMSGWECIMMKERGLVGEGLLSYALYAHDGAPLAQGFPVPAGYVRVNPVFTTADNAVRGSATIPLNTWTHLATTYDGANQQFFVNGVLVGTTPSTGVITASNGALRIGGNASSTGEFFQGFIDEVRVYNRALSAAEIAADMITPIVP